MTKFSAGPVLKGLFMLYCLQNLFCVNHWLMA